ncbi:MAG: hypothetical protein LCH95_10290 [Proteobacteria bacterium]|nr:hypothetical protein [Pseudomonadota bacterium]
MPARPPADRTLIVVLAVNGLLGASVGVLAAGVAGAQLGLAIGLAMTVLPRIARAVAAWLVRPHGLPRLLGREIARAALATGSALLAAGEAVARPLRRVLRLPALVLAMALDVTARLARSAVAAVGRLVFTPLGVANLAALGVIVASVAGIGLAGSVAFVALVLLLLVLLVDHSESRDAAANQSREGSPS